MVLPIAVTSARWVLEALSGKEPIRVLHWNKVVLKPRGLASYLKVASFHLNVDILGFGL